MKKRLMVFFMAVLMVLSMCFVASAQGVGAAEAQQKLQEALGSGQYHYQGGAGGADKQINYSEVKLETTGGGYTSWTKVVNSSGNDYINKSQFDQLTQESKRTVLEGMFEIANAMEDDNTNGMLSPDGSPTGVTSDTVESMMTYMQNNSGMGSQMLAMLMKNTKPNYMAANKIYEPFAGPLGTALALIAILIMALLGLTMALDIAYIVIPAFQMICGGGADAGQQGGPGGKKGGGIGGFISSEAKHAVKSAEGGQGGQAGGGEYKAAIGTYLKHRWIGLTILGICMLYLVQGQIYNFVAWFVDLFSGILNF